MTQPTGTDPPAAPSGPTDRSRAPGPPVPLPRYRLGTGIRLIPRGADLQIGTAAGRRRLLVDAPPRARSILDGLDGTQPADQLLAGDDDRSWWAAALHDLHRAGLLHGDGRPVQVSPGLVDERVDLTHRHGADAADLALGRRADAIVEVRGSGRIAGLTADLLAAAGVGHVHLTMTRTARSSDVLSTALTDGPSSSPPARSAGGLQEAVRPEDLGDGSVLRTSSTSSPPRLPPTVVVLAGDTAPEHAEVRDLMTTGTPHLTVEAADGRAVVGPLVLPGRSSCLWCLDLARADRDPDWATLRLATRAPVGAAPSVLAAGAAALGTAEVLHLVEGIRHPLTVDGTLEWDATQLPRRRSRRPHPDCGCTRHR